MNAHPMLQPVDWEQDPESLSRAIPEDRRRIYQVIWDCALAATLSPPRLRHTRALYPLGDMQIAVHYASPDPEHEGYWHFRKDWPRLPFPFNPSPHQNITRLHIKRGYAQKSDYVPLGALIEGITRKGISTPASLAKLLQGLAEGRLSSLVEQDATGLSWRLLPAGLEQTVRWLEEGLTGNAEASTTLIEAVADGDTGYRAACEQIFQADPSKIKGATDYIDAVCARWKGLGREAGLQAAALGDMGIPRHEGLPAWLDPENALKPDHPLRELKGKLEKEMIRTHAAWSVYSDAERADKRLEWLGAHVNEYKDLIPEMQVDGWSWSALRYWLTGAKK